MNTRIFKARIIASLGVLSVMAGCANPKPFQVRDLTPQEKEKLEKLGKELGGENASDKSGDASGETKLNPKQNSNTPRTSPQKTDRTKPLPQTPNMNTPEKPASPAEKNGDGKTPDIDDKQEKGANPGVAGEKKSAQTPEAEACRKEICDGSATIVGNQRKPNPISKSEMGQITALVETAYNWEALRLRELKKKLMEKDVQKLSISGPVADLLLLNLSLSKVSEVLAYIKVADDGKYTFNYADYSAKVPDSPKKLTPEMGLILNMYFDKPWFPILMNDLMPWDVMDRSKAGGKTPQEVMSEIGQEIKTTFTRVYTLTEQPFKTVSALEKAIKKQEMTHNEGADFVKMYMGTLMYKDVLDGSLKGVAEKSHFTESAAFKDLVSTPLKDFDLLDANVIQRKEACLKNLTHSLEYSPTREQWTKMQTAMALLKELAKTQANNLTKDGKMLQAIQQSITNTQFAFAEPQDVVQKSMVVLLNDMIAESMNTKMTDVYVLGSFIMNAKRIRNIRDKNTPFLNQECADFPVDTVSDSSWTNLNKIIISAPSTVDARYGFGVMAHEMGHVVFKTLAGITDATDYRKLDFQASAPVLQCENERVGGNQNYVNESFADAFAAHIMKEVKDESLKNNFGCTLGDASKRAFEFENKDTSDTHPGFFFRALLVANDSKGSLPNSCQAFLAQQNYTPSLKSCF